jgi:deoxyribodipyrimidine photo-lyase
MQSGTTGTNTLRIYSPLRQARVQDPSGVFIRRWLPELAAVPDAFIHAPHTMPPLVQQACGVVIGRHYPAPVVDEAEGLAFARARITAARRGIRESPEGRATTAALLARHGSRKPPPRRRAAGVAPVATQPSLPLAFVDPDGCLTEVDDDEHDSGGGDA